MPLLSVDDVEVLLSAVVAAMSPFNARAGFMPDGDPANS